MKTKNRIVSIALSAMMALSAAAALQTASYAQDITGSAQVAAYNASAKDYALSSVVSSGKYSYNTEYTSRYAYKKLSSSDQKLYKLIYEAVMNLESSVNLPADCTINDLAKIYTLVYHEEPQLFWMNSSFVRPVDGVFYLTYQFDTKTKIQSAQKKINASVEKIMKSASSKKTDFDKIKVFYDWIIKNNDFEISADVGLNGSIYNGFLDGTIQCAGYAKTMQYLLDLAGIESMVVTGTNEAGASHAWNVVKVVNGWYNLDTTWGDPTGTKFGSSFIQYEFFLVPDKWIKDITHFNENKLVLGGDTITLFKAPTCAKTTYNYFVKNKMNYSSTSAGYKALQAQMKEAVKNKKNVVEIRVTTKKSYEALIGKSYSSKLLKYVKGLSSSVSGLSVHSKYTAGSYIVHYDISYDK